MKKLLNYIVLLWCFTPARAQYAPQAGVPGTTAIHASSTLFAAWANHCNVYRGYIDIANKPAGYTALGDSLAVLSNPNSEVLSLGDSGVAVVQFAGTIYNGNGPDFAVFENGFPNPANPSMAFLELAFVEVSSDGERFVRFPASCLVPANTQIPGSGTYTDATKINNLAGKYIGMYGTPFDLDELKDSSGIDINSVTHIRIVDVVGSVGAHHSTDAAGLIINDPYPTNFLTGGFDLDAVGAIHINLTAAGQELSGRGIALYPNPATDLLYISGINPSVGYEVNICGLAGNKIQSINIAPGNVAPINIAHLQQGMYLLHIKDTNGRSWSERFVKQ